MKRTAAYLNLINVKVGDKIHLHKNFGKQLVAGKVLEMSNSKLHDSHEEVLHILK